MDNKYLSRKMIGWLSYNPNFEARDAQFRNNKVCYFYPRFLVQNGSYIPIDSKQDFPQVGRIAIWVQGGEDASIVVDRYGNLVCATLNRSLECNYESNNHYTARYNFDYGPKSSEIWISTIDASSFYEVVESFHTAESILKNNEISIPAKFCASTKYILINNRRQILGPFAYSLEKSKLILQGVAAYDYQFGVYNAPQTEKNMVVIKDNQDEDAVPLMPIELLPLPKQCKEYYDLIDDTELLNSFLETAKTRLDLNRKDFREIKEYINRVLAEDKSIDFSESRLKRLQEILPRIVDVKDHILDAFTSIMSNQEIGSVIVQELLKKYPDTLKESLASALGVGFKQDVKKGKKDQQTSDNDAAIPISLPAAALPYDVINSFFTNTNIQSLLKVLEDTAKSLAERIDHVHEGNQIIQSADITLEDFFSSANFYPEFREQLNFDLASLYNCLDNITKFIDQALGRDGDSSVNNKNPAAVALNDLSVKLSRLKDRLDLRQKTLNEDIRAEEIDLTLDKLKNDLDIEPVQCTLADVLHNSRLYAQHIAAPFKQECNRLKKLYENVDNLHNLEKQLTELTDKKSSLDSAIAELEQQRTQHEEALKQISEKFQEMVAPYKDQYQLAAKILDQNLIQSLTSNVPAMAVAPSQLPLEETTHDAVANVAEVSATDAKETKVNTNSKTLTVAQETTAEASDGIFFTDDAEQLKPSFNVECLDKVAKFESRKQVLDHLSVFFNKHAARKINNNDLANYLICITQSFITTFAGEPGTGKTSLCNLLAQSLGLAREDQNNRFVEISVERGWTSLKDFIGYYNPLTKRMEKSNSEIFDAFYELHKEAMGLHANAKQPNHITYEQLAPFFILLDEANLSPIEHYWAAFFRNCDDITKQQRTISLGGKANWFLPENLRFLATINIDHTTEELSARFLDRSWVITLDPQDIDLDNPDANDDLLYKDKVVPFACLKKLFTPQNDDKMPKELELTWQNIQEIFSSNECSLPIRPRNLKMIHNYCLTASSCMNCHGEYGRLAPLDYAVAQKILPTINGNGDRYRILIEKLREVCLPELMPLCAKHLERMQRTGGAELGFYQFFSR